MALILAPDATSGHTCEALREALALIEVLHTTMLLSSAAWMKRMVALRGKTFCGAKEACADIPARGTCSLAADTVTQEVDIETKDDSFQKFTQIVHQHMQWKEGG